MSLVASISDIFPQNGLLYVHDNQSEPSGVLGQAFYYIRRNNERALLALRDIDVAVLNEEPDPAFVNYLRSIGLPANYVVVGDSSSDWTGSSVVTYSPASIVRTGNSMLHAFPDCLYYPFYSNDSDISAASYLGLDYFGTADSSVTYKYFDKIAFRQCARSLGLPVAAGESVPLRTDDGSIVDLKTLRGNLRSAIEKYIVATGSVLVLPPCSAGGIGILVVGKHGALTVSDAIEKIIVDEYAAKFAELLVVTKETVVESPTLFGYIGFDGSIHFGSKTVQLLKDHVLWAGTVMDLENQDIDGEMYRQSVALCQMMASDGYVGAFGFDFIETVEGVLMPVECNARVTGSHIPFECAQRLKEATGKSHSCVLMAKIPSTLKFPTFEHFLRSPLAHFLLSKESENGVIPLRYYKMLHGEFEIMIFAESLEMANVIKAGFQASVEFLSQVTSSTDAYSLGLIDWSKVLLPSLPSLALAGMASAFASALGQI